MKLSVAKNKQESSAWLVLVIMLVIVLAAAAAAAVVVIVVVVVVGGAVLVSTHCRCSFSWRLQISWSALEAWALSVFPYHSWRFLLQWWRRAMHAQVRRAKAVLGVV